MGHLNRMLLTLGVCIIAVVGIVQSAVNLTPIGTITVDENNPATLKCTYVGTDTNLLFRWIKVIGEVGGVDDITEGQILTSSCSVFGSINSTKYSYSCSGGQQVLWTINNVDRSNNGDRWRCRVSTSTGTTENSGVVSISVRVPIQSVTMTLPVSDATIVIVEDTQTTFTCRADGLPAADIKWYKVNGTPSASKVGIEITNTGSTTIVTTSSTLADGLIRGISTLTYRPTGTDNGMRVYCSASNVGQTHISTKQPQLNVLHRATGPTFDGYTNGGTYLVTENTTGSLTCRTTGGNPLPTLSWSCYSGSTSTVGTTGTTVMSTRTWTASRDTDRTCTCTSTQQGLTGSRTVSVQVEILYPPSTPVLKVNSISVGNIVKVILNNNLRILCSSSGKPTPSYTWTLPDNTQQQGELLEVKSVQKSDKGQYTCRATNNPGSGQVALSSSTTVEVQFGPTTPRIYYDSLFGSPISTNTPFNIVVGDTWPIVCQSEGQPAPSYTWTIDNKQYTGQTTTLPAVYRNMSTSIGCRADNVLEETGSTGTTEQSSTSSVTMAIVYPPNDLAISLKYEAGNDMTVSDSISVLEGAAFVLKCLGSSNPGPSYDWSGRGSQTSSEISIPSGTINRNGSHVYSCEVTNQMTRTYGTPSNQPGRKTINVTVHALYGPELLQMTDQSTEEDKPFIYSCPYRNGNPDLTTVKWTRADNNRTWNSESLTISTVSRRDAMMYTCTVSNVMEPTNMEPVSDPKSGQLYLDVKYKASVTSFKVGQNSVSVTVTENMSPTLDCNVESNPASNMKILFKNQILTENINSLQLTHQLSNVSCSNIGVYKCTGGNYLNAQSLSTKDIELFVKCKPQAYGETVTTVYTALHNSATLRLYSLAYPTIKSFTWTKHGTPDEPLKNSTKVYMNMSRVKVDGIYIDIFRLDLTLNNVSSSDFGRYKLLARNDQGTIERDFVLEPEDSPEQPTQLTHLEKFIKTTTATIQWAPGFNGGPNQTFILLYKRITDSEWNTFSVKDSGESIMNYTLTGLQSDTQYEVKIYAQNRVGNSSTTSSIEIRTLDAVAEKSTNTGSIIGGVFGGAAGLAIIGVLIVVFLRRYDFTKATEQDSNIESDRREHQQSNRTNEDAAVSYYNIGREGPLDSQVNNEATYYNESVVPEYETLNQQKQDTTTYSSLKPSSGDQSKDNKENKVYENLQLRVI